MKVNSDFNTRRETTTLCSRRLLRGCIANANRAREHVQIQPGVSHMCIEFLESFKLSHVHRVSGIFKLSHAAHDWVTSLFRSLSAPLELDRAAATRMRGENDMRARLVLAMATVATPRGSTLFLHHGAKLIIARTTPQTAKSHQICTGMAIALNDRFITKGITSADSSGSLGLLLNRASKFAPIWSHGEVPSMSLFPAGGIDVKLRALSDQLSKCY